MGNKYAYLSKNILLFSIGGFIPKILSFILIPIYTDCLTPAEYGIADLLYTTVSLLVPIFTLDIQDAVIRYAMDRNYKQKDVFSVAVKIILFGTAIVGIGSFGLSFLHIEGVRRSYLVFFFLSYFTTAAYNSVSLFCRGIDKVDVMVVGSIINSVVSLLTNILFLVVFNWGFTGYLLANTLGSVIALVWCFFGAKLYQYISWYVSKDLFKDMVVYSFPLIFSAISWWINNSSDRYILSWLAGVSATGIYAVAYKIPNLLTVFQNVFFQAWSISAIKEFDKNDSDGFIGNIYTLINGGMVVGCSAIMVLNIPLARILYSNEFYDAWRFVPPLLVSVVFNAMALFIGSIFTAVKDTKTVATSTIIGAIVNTAGNIVLIYACGTYGAAIATLLGYAVVLSFRHVILRKHIILRIKWGRDIIAYSLLIIQMLLSIMGLELIIAQILVLALLVMLYRKELSIVMLKLRSKIQSKHSS